MITVDIGPLGEGQWFTIREGVRAVRPLCCLQYLFSTDGIIRTPYKMGFLVHVPGHSKFRIHVILHHVSVAVQMIRRNVGDHPDIKARLIQGIQLK